MVSFVIILLGVQVPFEYIWAFGVFVIVAVRTTKATKSNSLGDYLLDLDKWLVFVYVKVWTYIKQSLFYYSTNVSNLYARRCWSTDQAHYAGR
jgi:hypothetical protein